MEEKVVDESEREKMIQKGGKENGKHGKRKSRWKCEKWKRR